MYACGVSIRSALNCRLQSILSESVVSSLLGKYGRSWSHLGKLYIHGVKRVELGPGVWSLESGVWSLEYGDSFPHQ